MASCNHWKRRMRTFLSDFPSFLHIIFVLVGLTTRAKGDLDIKENDVSDWAAHFGFQLHEIAKYMTYMQDIKDEFEQLGAWVKRKDGTKMVQEMSADIEKMMAWKIQAVQRITETAEQAMMGHVFDTNLEFEYNNAKTLNKGGVELQLTKDKHFYNMPVNSSNSSIHVPTNVYNKAADVLNAIRWSEHLNPIFQSNYHLDPSLNWQYFGSSTGFLRQYPAWEWPMSAETVDMYDCRMRPWYIEAATSPKDMVILIDTSGSMTGLRKEIAKHVAFNILDTLNDDDYFTIYNFSDSTDDLVPCFNNSLVPANMENIREFKKGLQYFKPEGIANFSRALTTAFDILQRYKHEGLGSMCNQAIMLVTDGAPQTFEELFNNFNQNKSVRMFTYMIGQEMTNEQEIEWIACNNRGYYSHVSTIAEARDQVQHYIPVMARPLVLHQKHNVIWTSVYADIEDPKMSDFLWEKGEKAIQRKLSLTSDYDYYGSQSDAPKKEYDEQEEGEDYYANDTKDMEPLSSLSMMAASAGRSAQSDSYRVSNPDYYRLITTVAYPVFDRCNCSNETFGGFQYRSPPRFPKKDPLAPPSKINKVAHLLGVAGTDVPIDEITKLAPPYKLGVNGYSFGITNNGYILFHPDLRHLYDGPDHTTNLQGPPILKPDYNSVDLAEAELRDNDLPPRGDDPLLLMLRKKMIDREINRTRMSVKIHQDGMRRVVTRTQEYFYSPLKETPFSFGIAMPEGYGMHEIVGMIELKDPKLTFTSLFEKRGNWTIHPDWVYCRYLYSNSERAEQTREEAFVHFLESIHNRTVNLDNQHRVKPLPKFEDYSYSKAKKINKNEFYCDKELVQSVVFDADALKVVARRGRNNKTRRTTAHKKNITVVFVATRSGLTRWEDFEAAGRNFILKNNRAIDELWYRRAVDYHAIDNKSFVYSVPFDAGSRNSTHVTASYAIFLNNGSHFRAPAAVVGMQMKLDHFVDLFREITGKCPSEQKCSAVCGSEVLNCYLLDNNGFVVYSKDRIQTGKFYGEIDRNIMNALVQDNIYRRIRMVDYQAVCLDHVYSTDSSSFLLTPLNHLRSLLAWTWSKILFFYFNFTFINFGKNVNTMSDNDADHNRPPHLQIINKTRPKPCDKEYYLFQLKPKRFDEHGSGHSAPRKGKLYGCTSNTSASSATSTSCNKSFVVHVVPYTNLIMLAVESTCSCETSSFTLDHTEIKYNETQMCRWLSSNIYRRRPDQCVNFHEQELEIKGHCGRGMLVVPSMPIVVCALSLARWFQRRSLFS